MRLPADSLAWLADLVKVVWRIFCGALVAAGGSACSDGGGQPPPGATPKKAKQEMSELDRAIHAMFVEDPTVAWSEPTKEVAGGFVTMVDSAVGPCPTRAIAWDFDHHIMQVGQMRWPRDYQLEVSAEALFVVVAKAIAGDPRYEVLEESSLGRDDLTSRVWHLKKTEDEEVEFEFRVAVLDAPYVFTFSSRGPGEEVLEGRREFRRLLDSIRKLEGAAPPPADE